MVSIWSESPSSNLNLIFLTEPQFRLFWGSNVTTRPSISARIGRLYRNVVFFVTLGMEIIGDHSAVIGTVIEMGSYRRPLISGNHSSIPSRSETVLENGIYCTPGAGSLTVIDI